MEMMEKLSNFIENYNGAFFVGNLVTEKIIYINRKAQSLFNVTLEDCDFTKILGISSERIKFSMDMTIEKGKNSMIYDYTVIKGNGEKVLVDLQVGYFNKENTEVFLELIPRKDTRMQTAIEHIGKSLRPEAILNIDDKLSIIHCNNAFHEVFDSNEELRHSHFQNDLVNGFLPELREKLIKDILETLEKDKSFSTKIKVFSATGEEYWYLFELERRTLDGSGTDKAMCYMTNIEKQVELEENFEYVNQFFEVVQNFSNDIYYRIEVDTMTLNHFVPTQKLNHKIQQYKQVIPDYVNTLISKDIIHPDDHETCRQFVAQNIKGNRSECSMRFSWIGNKYKWYRLKGYNVYDENGNLLQIIGALINIDEEENIKEANSYLNQYLTIMQETTTDLLYRVDVETKTLYHFSSIKNILGARKSIPNYIETFLDEDIVHPDDKQLYLKGLEEFNNGIDSKVQIRFSLDGKQYKWYRVTGKRVYEKNGRLKEVFGALVDIDNECKMQNEANTLNSYFEALELISGESFYVIDVNERTLTQRGKVAEELGVTGHLPNFPESAFDMIHPEDLEIFKEYTYNSMKGIISKAQVRVLNLEGEYKWYELHSQVIMDENGQICKVFGKMNNIHDGKIMSEEFSMLYQYFDALQDLTDDRIFHIDIKKQVFRFTDSSNENHALSFKNDNFVEQLAKMGRIIEEDTQVYKDFFDNIINGDCDGELRIQAKTGGKLQWHIVKTKLIKNKNNEPIEIFGKLENIQEKVDLEQKANFDKLTGVLSRETFEDKILEELKNMPENECNALIFIDIDDFKFINDNYGHSYGDFILQKFAKRVGNCIKNTDLMGRVGGDEFVIYLKSIANSEMALERANTMLERMKRPISDGNITHTLGLSIGISVTPTDGTDLGTLYENADKTVYESKKRGKNTATLYTKD